jgi:phosphosulfolactate phosphohydrolase-like enzyme
LRATADAVQVENAPRLLIICAGTFEETAYEDTLAAGALCDLVWKQFAERKIADSAQIARQIYRDAGDDSQRAMQYSRNARRLLANPALRDDVAFCLRRDCLDFTAEMRDGIVKKHNGLD